MTGRPAPGAGETRPLLPADRLEVIKSLVQERGSVRASELVDLFGVTDETIRRDLSRLAKAGGLRRAHGGAVAVRPQDERTTEVRLYEYAAEKIAIGNRAAQLVEDGSTIILDSGTTTLCLARALRLKRDLTVVTSAVTNAFELLGVPGMTVVMTGGVIRPVTYGATGRLAVASLRELHVDQVFLATHSVSARGGLSYPSIDEVDVKRAMIEAAARVVLLADHSKFGRESLAKIAPITAVDTIITDPGIDPAEADAIREAGVELIIAPLGAEQSGEAGPEPT
ncbi:MAG: DeoR/GlpR family DNA-binding transcription regulator [Candidatus Limnocylindrales bacterium]